MTLNNIINHIQKHNKSKKLGCTCPFLLKGRKVANDMNKMDAFVPLLQPEKYVLVGEIYDRKVFIKL